MNEAEYRFGPFRLLPAARELWNDGHLDTPARLVFDCLAYLVRHRDRAIGRDELVAAIWGRVDIAEARVSELVLRARRAVGDDGQAQRVIRTVPGFGYRWIAPVGGDAVAAGDTEATPESVPDPVPATPAAAAPSLPQRPRFARRPDLIVAATLALAVASALVAWGVRQPAPAPEPTAAAPAAPAVEPHTVVLPLQVHGPPGSGWLRLGTMELIAERLAAAGLRIPPSESVLGVLGGATGTAARAPLERAFGKALVVEGEAIREGGLWRIGLATTTADGVQHRVDASHRDATEAARQAGDLLLAALGRMPPVDSVEQVDDGERLRQIQAALLANEIDAAGILFEQLDPVQAGTPDIRYQHARLDLLAGRPAAAETTLSELIADPRVQARRALLAKAFTLRAAVQFRRAAFAAAEKDYDAAIATLETADAPAERGLALSGRGAARLARQHYDAAALDLGQARILFGQAGDAFGLAQVDANFGLLEAEQGRAEKALPYLAGAADRFEVLGAVERLLSVLDPLFDLQTALLQWPQARATSDRQWALRERVRDPGQRLMLTVNRSVALAAQGSLREADRLLREAEPWLDTVQAPLPRYYHAQRARLDLAQGQPAAAAAAADRALAAWTGQPNDWQRSQVVLLRQHALVAAGAGSSTIDAELAPLAAADPAQIAPALLVALAERSMRDDAPQQTEQLFGQALEAASRHSVPADLVVVVAAQARWLLAVGRTNDAAALAGRIAPWADRDFECALLQVAILQALGPTRTWSEALQQARALAGERPIPTALTRAPPGA